MITRKITANIGLNSRKSLNPSKAILKGIAITIFAATITSNALADAAAPQRTIDNWVNGSGEHVLKNGTGEYCWRDGFWTSDTAASGCDGAKVAQLPAPVLVPPVIPAPPVVTSQKITYHADALFDFDKAVLKAEGKTKLDKLVDDLQAVNYEEIISVGYTDRIGSDIYNLNLSNKRANSVKNYLVSKGIDANRISTQGRGKNDPIITECPDVKKGLKENRHNKDLIACLGQNRRVEIEVVGTKTVESIQQN